MKIALWGFSGFVGSYFLNHSKFEIVPVNLRKIDMSTYQTSEDIDTFVNLVGKAHDHKSIATEEDYYYANLQLTKQIFNVFKDSNAKLFIHVSSLAAVEEFKSVKPLEENDVCKPFSVYGKSKRKAEEWLLAQKLTPDRKIIIIRPPMIHGPGDKGNLGLLYKLISKGIPYPLASFKNNRSLISIDNFCFYISEIIKKKDSIESGIYHISDDESISTQKIIDTIKKVSQKKTVNLFIPKCLVEMIAKIGDFLPLPLNTKRLKKMTGNLLVSNKKIKLALQIQKLPLTAEEGLIKTIKSFKK